MFKVFGQSAFSQLSDEYLELAKQYQDLREEASLAWREVGSMGQRLANWDAEAKAAADADERVQRAERTASVASWRNLALETFYTDLMAGEYDHGKLPVPQDAQGEAEAELCKS